MFGRFTILAEEDREHLCPQCHFPTYVVWFGEEWPSPDGDVVEVTARTETRKCCLCGKTWSSPQALLAEAKGTVCEPKTFRWKFCGPECPLKRAADR